MESRGWIGKDTELKENNIKRAQSPRGRTGIGMSVVVSGMIATFEVPVVFAERIRETIVIRLDSGAKDARSDLLAAKRTSDSLDLLLCCCLIWVR